ncbi:hypothetical protein Slin15195_G092430 [Septoria linicola]|uniref:Uncharacterized protein n=1 Tax=Septoria linicola TaxID=215465 RepID=A0A9Q9AV05_9PEZI|nr:hypothetical protein Slin15195_G092430 [Septoria linicola]
MAVSKVTSRVTSMAVRSLHTTRPLRDLYANPVISKIKQENGSKSMGKSLPVKNKKKYGVEVASLDAKNVLRGAVLGLAGAKVLEMLAVEEVEWSWEGVRK